MTPEERSFQARVERWIQQCTGDPEIRVLRAERLPGGASRETWFLELTTPNPSPLPRKLALRRDPPGSHAFGQRREEHRLLQVLRDSGVPVPRVFWLAEDAEALGAPGFLMEWIEGETVPRRLLRDPKFEQARRVLPAQLAVALAQIHAVSWQERALTFLPCPDPGETAASFELNRLEALYRAISPDPHPTFEWAIAWLRERASKEQRRTLVHGDFRLGNLLVGPDGLHAVLDWELAHIGDPMEDIGWICVRSWRFGVDHLPVAGLAKREEFCAAYERASGLDVDPQRVRYWEILGNLKWGIITIFQARSGLDQTHPDLERAAIGRRTAETEWELLHLLSESC